MGDLLIAYVAPSMTKSSPQFICFSGTPFAMTLQMAFQNHSVATGAYTLGKILRWRPLVTTLCVRELSSPPELHPRPMRPRYSG